MKPKLTLKLSSIEEVREFRKTITSMRVQLLQFQAIIIRKNAEILIVDAIHKRMAENGFSKKIIQNTYLKDIEFKSKTKIRLIFTSVLFSDTGFDVALAREKGTRRHKTAPTKKKAQRFIDGGVEKFSKGHWVDGLPALKIIETVIDERAEHFQMAYDRDLADWFEKNMEGVKVNAI